MKQGTTLFLLMFFVPWMLHAQEAPQTISLQQAVEFAIKHNKELQSSQMNIDLYRQKVRESVSQGLPPSQWYRNVFHEFQLQDGFRRPSDKNERPV